MTEGSRSFLEMWLQMSIPESEESLSIRRVRGAENVLLSKDSEGTFGIVMHGVTDDFRNPRLANLSFSTRPRMILNISGSNENLANCLILKTSSDLDPVMLSLVMEHLLKSGDTEKFSAHDLSNTIREVIKLTRREAPPPTRDEIVGAWGELYILLKIVSETSGHTVQRMAISGWEGLQRQTIDFRFPEAGVALEAKTCSDGLRMHHIGGYGQITIPAGFDCGALVSVSVQDNDHGKTCKDLVHAIRHSLCGTEEEIDSAKSLLEDRVRIRGSECLDDSIFLWLEDDEDPMRLYRFDDVPSPVSAGDVFEVEWVADLMQASPMSGSERGSVMDRIRLMSTPKGD